MVRRIYEYFFETDLTYEFSNIFETLLSDDEDKKSAAWNIAFIRK